MADEETVETTEEPAKEPSMEETMAAAFDKAQEPDAVEETADDSAGDASEATDATEEDTAAETQEAAEETTSDHREEVKAEPAPETEPAINAPASWSPAARDEWTSLPPAIQQEVLKRESDIQKGMQQSAERLKGYGDLDSVIEPLQQAFALNGVTAAQYFGQLATADKFIRENPVEGLKWIAKTYNVPLDQMSPAAAEDEYADPQFKALQDQIAQLQSAVTQTAQATGQIQTDGVEAMIQAFQAEPGHEHFDDVRDYMGILMEAGKAPDMEAAYRMAIWADPVIREKVRSAEKEAEAAERKKRAEAKAKEARKVASTNLSSNSPPGGSTPKSQSMEDTMKETFDRMQG